MTKITLSLMSSTTVFVEFKTESVDIAQSFLIEDIPELIQEVHKGNY